MNHANKTIVMARQIGLAFTGRIDGLSFYHDRLNGYLVRRTGGVSSKQYRTDDRYAAARDASVEFSTISRTGKLIRDALSPFLLPVKDGTMVNRLNKELVALKQSDPFHSRGKRKPETMMTDQEANRHFRIFQFNEAVKTHELTRSFPMILRQQNALVMKVGGLLPTSFPEGATLAGLTMIRTVIDFDQGCFETSSSRMTLVSPESKEERSLVICEIPTCVGIELICLQVVFFAERNGDLVQLSEKVHSMGIVGVQELSAQICEVSYSNGIAFSGKAEVRVLKEKEKQNDDSPLAYPKTFTYISITKPFFMNNLRIDSPCPVLLSRMTNNGDTFSCKSCKKEVIDFRNKTPEEIRLLITENSCGIFNPEQLTVVPRLSFSRQLLFTSLTVLSFLGFNVSSVQAAQPISSQKTEMTQLSYHDDKDKEKDREKRKKARRHRRWARRGVVGKF